MYRLGSVCPTAIEKKVTPTTCHTFVSNKLVGFV
jgi:hypothetical protein